MQTSSPIDLSFEAGDYLFYNSPEVGRVTKWLRSRTTTILAGQRARAEARRPLNVNDRETLVRAHELETWNTLRRALLIPITMRSALVTCERIGNELDMGRTLIREAAAKRYEYNFPSPVRNANWQGAHRAFVWSIAAWLISSFDRTDFSRKLLDELERVVDGWTTAEERCNEIKSDHDNRNLARSAPTDMLIDHVHYAFAEVGNNLLHAVVALMDHPGVVDNADFPSALWRNFDWARGNAFLSRQKWDERVSDPTDPQRERLDRCGFGAFDPRQRSNVSTFSAGSCIAIAPVTITPWRDTAAVDAGIVRQMYTRYGASPEVFQYGALKPRSIDLIIGGLAFPLASQMRDDLSKENLKKWGTPEHAAAFAGSHRVKHSVTLTRELGLCPSPVPK